MNDCPKCGKPNSAYGDNFCGTCEAEYQAEQERQEWLNRYHFDPYNDTWGHFIFTMVEGGPEYTDSLINDTIAGLWGTTNHGTTNQECPEELKLEILKACTEAKLQRAQNLWNPPATARAFVPCV